MKVQILLLVLFLQFFAIYTEPTDKKVQCPFHRAIRGLLKAEDEEENCGEQVISCPSTNYRSHSGSCNNLLLPSLGVPNTKYARLLPENYGDGISAPTLAKSGKALPNARKVSTVIYPDTELKDQLWTLNAMQYGQFMSHDLSLLMPQSVSCCSDGQVTRPLSAYCYQIDVPPDDPAYSPLNISCLDFSRTVTDFDKGCNGTSPSVEQLSIVNHYLDLSLVYGNSENASQLLRSFSGGKLIAQFLNNQEMLPFADSCTVANTSCYLAGDTRVNQNPQLSLLHTIFLREHNRVAEFLAKLNPHWDEERLYQETRKIVIAEHQQISYYEWLPIIIGTDNSFKNSVLYNTTDFVADYNSSVDISVYNEFSTAAFRFFHTLIAGTLELISESRETTSSTRISNYWNNPNEILSRSFDDLARGLSTQAELAADAYHDKEITLNWLRSANGTIGQDLKAVCIQRNRDHGLATYNDHRELCGLPRAKVFEDFLDVMNQSNVDKLAALYEHPDDVEITVGGSLESIISKTLVGPTFQCILTKQFYKTRVGDRFWYENPGPTGFTLDQLNEIRKSTISRLMCENSAISQIQPQGFKIISETNTLMFCSDLPTVNLTLWKEEAPAKSWFWNWI